MSKAKSFLLLFLTLLGTILAFWGGIRLFEPRNPAQEAQIWRVPVETIPAMSVVPSFSLNRLLDLGQAGRLCEPELPCLVPLKPSIPPAPPPRILPPEPMVAIIIDDVGLLPQAAGRLLKLPAPITLSFLPYAPNLESQIRAAKEAGHEIMLHVPMEPIGKANPGPNALLTSLDSQEVERRTLININAFTGYVGLNNHMGSRFTSDRNKIAMFFKVLYQNRGSSLFFIDSRTAATSVAEEEARRAGFPSLARDIFLDDRIDPESIREELANLERIARRRGFALAIGHPHAVTLDVLEIWMPQAQARGLRIVPVGQLVR